MLESQQTFRSSAQTRISQFRSGYLELTESLEQVRERQFFQKSCRSGLARPPLLHDIVVSRKHATVLNNEIQHFPWCLRRWNWQHVFKVSERQGWHVVVSLAHEPPSRQARRLFWRESRSHDLPGNRAQQQQLCALRVGAEKRGNANGRHTDHHGRRCQYYIFLPKDKKLLVRV